MTKESFYKKDPMVLESTGDEPKTPEATTATPDASATPEAAPAENVFARGEARFQKVGETITSSKTKLANFFGRIPQVANAWKDRAGSAIRGGVRAAGSAMAEGARAATVGALSAPELAQAGMARVGETAGAAVEGLERGGAAFAKGVGNFEDSMSSGMDFAANWGADRAEAIAEFARTKKEQFGNYLTEKAEAVKSVGELGANFTVEKAAQARTQIDGGIRNVSEWGARSLVSAETKRQEVMDMFRKKMNEMRLEKLKRQHAESTERTATLQRKLELMGSLG